MALDKQFCTKRWRNKNWTFQNTKHANKTWDVRYLNNGISGSVKELK